MEPRQMEHKIQQHDYRVVDRDFGSANDRFQEQMRRMDEEMRRFHEKFRPGGAGSQPQTGVGAEKLPTFATIHSQPVGPDRHRTTMDVQLNRPVTQRIVMQPQPCSDMQITMTRPNPVTANFPSIRKDPWQMYFDSNPDSSLMEQTQDGKKLKLRFDVNQYTPDEVHVKTVGNKLMVSAKHEEKGDSNSNFREFQREFHLPDNIDPETLKSSLSKDGILTVEAPLVHEAIEQS